AGGLQSRGRVERGRVGELLEQALALGPGILEAVTRGDHGRRDVTCIAREVADLAERGQPLDRGVEPGGRDAQLQIAAARAADARAGDEAAEGGRDVTDLAGHAIDVAARCGERELRGLLDLARVD